MMSLLGFFVLSGCESIGLPNIFAHDQVPESVKQQPSVLVFPPPADDRDWPRLGDVPFKPKGFSSKQDYEQSMDELERQRYEGEMAHRNVFKDGPRVNDAAPQNLVLQPPEFEKN
jgi:hypothetical protein